MKIFIRPRKIFLLYIPFILLLLFAFSIVSHAQTLFGVASSPGVDPGAQAGPTTAGIIPPASMVAGDLVVIFAENRATGATLTMGTTGGQTWNTTTSNSGSGLTTRILWCTYNGTWASNPTVTGGAAGVGLSAVMYVYRPSSSTSVWTVNVNTVNNTTLGTNPNTINSVSTTSPHSVTMAFWGSAFANTWTPSGGTLPGSWSKTGLLAQYRNTTGGQSITAAYNIQTTTTGGVGNVAQDEGGTATATRTSIMSWSELPNNDLCANATTLTSASTCVTTTGSVVNATYTGPLTNCLGATPTYDVWYKFVAQTTNPTVTVNIGASGANINQGKMQMFSGACGAFTALMPCGTYDVSIPDVGVRVGTINATGLAIGQTYYVRVYSPNGVPTSNGTFTICVTDPAPINDDCGGAITLTPGTTCTNTQGNVVGATLSSPVPLPICGTPVYDIWYQFVAQSTLQSVTISSPTAPASMANFINPGIQVLSGACGSLFTVACNTGTTVTASGLTIGNTYYVRVYSTSAVPASNGAFNICITNLPANDDCSNAIPLTSAVSCITTSGTLVNATNVAVPNTCAASSGTRADVWYSFTAHSTNPTITIGSGPANSRFEVFSGTCGGLTSVFCSTSASQATSGLTIGVTYLVRVYSNTGASGTFTICIIDPNDNCAGAMTLTSSTSCVNYTGNMYGATFAAVTITADCAGAVVYDVWYKFVAQTPNPTITLSNIGIDIANPGMELLSGGCGSQTAIMCGTTSIAANYLTPGTTYYIRVYSTSGVAPPSPTNGGYNICIVDPVSTPPFNDDCANAINLPIWNSCNNISGSVAGATPSTAPGLSAPCAGTVTYDVWFKFTAITNTTSTITLGSLGANFTSTGLQIFSGTCGSLTSIACATGTTVTTPALTIGTVYYVRVFSTAASVPNGNARFNVCATTTNAPVRFGNSYVNISKKATGGVIEPGDTLEIRMTVNHSSGTMYHLRYVDNIPTHTSMLTGTKDSIRIITNEGLTYKRYTLAGGDDAGTYNAAPPAGQYNIRLNLGFGGSLPGTPADNSNTEFASATGQMSSGDNPRGNGLLFATSYKVVVTGVAGDTVKLNAGQFIYQTAASGQPDVTLTATPFNILISNPLNLCANSIGLNNAVENGGTFGSGTTLTRSTDLTTPIAGYTFIPDVSPFNVVGDGRYSIVKNISPQNGTQRLARRQNTCNTPSALMSTDPFSCANRMFNGFWYVDGDHTGTNNAIGNVPPDLPTPSGYMLEVNADYVASEVYRQTVSNLCPNTYYEFSAWVRNICTVCGIDSLGHQFAASTIPALQNGYPGVLPNLTFTLNDLDYYNTGELDTVGWQKKGFVFKTGPTQTTASFSIRNNAQGGGGNDWTLDDIAIATCLPSMMYSPSITPAICQGNSLQINDTVRSYFNNYTHYKWQRSTDGGNNWSDITANHDTTLTFNGSIYQFMTSYTIPASHTTLADSGDLYRVIVATLDSNLSNAACLFTDASTIITLKVLDCGVPLGIDFISFSGKLDHGNADLIWTTSKENEPVSYSVERSYDGTNFSSIGTLPGRNNPNAANNTYKFTDFNVQSTVWYRIAMVNKDGHKKYSRLIMLDDKTMKFGLTSVINPFSTKLDFGITVSENSRIDATLLNIAGKPIRKESFNVYEGANSLTINDTETLSAGMYILQIRNKDQIINKKVMKK